MVQPLDHKAGQLGPDRAIRAYGSRREEAAANNRSVARNIRPLIDSTQKRLQEVLKAKRTAGIDTDGDALLVEIYRSLEDLSAMVHEYHD